MPQVRGLDRGAAGFRGLSPSTSSTSGARMRSLGANLPLSLVGRRSCRRLSTALEGRVLSYDVGAGGGAYSLPRLPRTRSLSGKSSRCCVLGPSLPEDGRWQPVTRTEAAPCWAS